MWLFESGLVTLVDASGESVPVGLGGVEGEPPGGKVLNAAWSPNSRRFALRMTVSYRIDDDGLSRESTRLFIAELAP